MLQTALINDLRDVNHITLENIAIAADLEGIYVFYYTILWCVYVICDVFLWCFMICDVVYDVYDVFYDVYDVFLWCMFVICDVILWCALLGSGLLMALSSLPKLASLRISNTMVRVGNTVCLYIHNYSKVHALQ